jgi:DNA repair exonuclease SbcCD ATPase subunit
LDSSLRDLISEVTQSRVDTLNEVEQAGNSAERIRTQIAATQRLVEFLEEDRKMSDMDIILSDPNLADASAGIETAKTVATVVKTLAEVAGEVSNDEATKITESLSEPLSRWFERISRHDMLKKARVTTRVSRAGGIIRNTYEIRATDTASSNHVPAGHNLSGGYEMVLAVPALCAIQELASLNHSMGLFILDEPTESLDPELVETMGTSLGLHAPGHRTIITTNRPEFARLVQDAAGAARGKIINLEIWTVNNGTRVKS